MTHAFDLDQFYTMQDDLFNNNIGSKIEIQILFHNYRSNTMQY